MHPISRGHPLDGAKVYNPEAMFKLLEQIERLLADPTQQMGRYSTIPYEGADGRWWEIDIQLKPVGSEGPAMPVIQSNG